MRKLRPAKNKPPPPPGLCIECNIQPKYVENGHQHPYCGKTCAARNKTSRQLNAPTAPALCINCHRRPQYFDGNKTHPYCGKTCAAAAVASTSNGTPRRMVFNNIAPQSAMNNACLMCRQVPKRDPHNFCGTTCGNNALNKAPLLLDVPNGHTTFTSVADQFKKTWRHNTKCPTVKAIYKVVVSRQSMANYDAYRKAVEARGNFVARGKSAGNENRRWHGTTRGCLLGDNGQTQFCSSTACSLCNIIKTSFDLNFFGKQTSWGRFGKGIYTSSTSSKSNDYSRNQQTSAWKAVLLNKVVVGKGQKLFSDNPSLTAAPAGFDSVLADPGQALNHDELIVYTNDAIRPSFLVMYAV